MPFTKTCPYCRIVFTSRASAKKFCSQSCAQKNRAKAENKPILVCKICGKTFQRYRSLKSQFCSLACAGKSNAIIQQGRILKPNSYVTMECPYCGKEFTRRKCHVRAGCLAFCSKPCSHEYHSRRLSGANHPRYIDGKVRERGDNWHVQRRLAKKRDNRTCQICGSHHKLNVHHIRAYRLFNGDWQSANELSNLITLCKSCHLKVEWGTVELPT